MENSAPLRTYVSATQLHIPFSQLFCVRMCVKPLSEFVTKNSGGNDCFSIYADSCICDHEKSSAKVPLVSVRHL